MSAITVNCFKQGGKRDELGHDLDEFISNDFIFGNQYGILGSNDSCCIDYDRDECGILGNETEALTEMPAVHNSFLLLI